MHLAEVSHCDAIRNAPIIRRKELSAFKASVTNGKLSGEFAAMHAKPPFGAVRVLVMRHGMGRHNELRGALSVFNRDASLNRAGRAQVAIVREALQVPWDLVIVSPFVRTLETAAGLAATSTIVQPLCAEHTLLKSALQRGDRGSTAEHLRKRFPSSEFPQYDFSTLDAYCASRGIKSGSWWHHRSDMWCETREMFARRCREFRRWLADECTKRGAKKVLVVCHGAFMKECFGIKVGTCEGLVMDVFHDGSFEMCNVGAACEDRREFLESKMRRNESLVTASTHFGSTDECSDGEMDSDDEYACDKLA